MGQPTQEEINEAIKTCKWRQPFNGTDICAGVCNICLREIQAGRCDTLQRLFAECRKEQIDGKTNQNE